jgi:hypothetical protein
LCRLQLTVNVRAPNQALVLNKIFRRRYQPKDGDLITVLADDGLFAVAKVLHVDAGGVHVRLYVQRFKKRPAFKELPPLSTAPFGPEHDNPFSIGHVPLRFEAFSAWEPEFLAHGDVLDEELEGYRMWLDAEAGYF